MSKLPRCHKRSLRCPEFWSAGGHMTVLKWMAAMAFVAASSGAAFAQTEGSISGSVRDQTGAFVPGATVTVKNERNGATRTATTTDRGTFLISPLTPSTYTITVEKQGF